MLNRFDSNSKNHEALVKLINQHHRPEQYCYVLLDPLVVPEGNEQSLLTNLKSALASGAVIPVVRPDLPHAPRVHPRLVCLGAPGCPPSAALLALTARAAEQDMHRRKRQVCGWLLSEAPPSTIAAHLTALCRLPDASGAITFYPIYQPLRLELLGALLEPRGQGPWWPIERWVFLTSGGSLAGLKGQPHLRCGLPASAIDTQRDVALIEAVLAAWRKLPVRPGARQIPPFAAVRASNHINDARALGLSVQQDIAVMAVHLLYLHAHLHTQTTLRDQIDRAIRQQRPLAEMFAQFSDSSWQHLLATLPQTEAHP